VPAILHCAFANSRSDEGNAKENDGTIIKIAIRCDFYVLLWLFIANQTKNRILLRICIFVRKELLIFAQKSQYIEIMTQREIGNAIKERRKKLGVNQQTLADLASVAVNTVVAIERGEGNPQLATLFTILDTLGLQIDINIKQLDYETM
jgi:y4mF family transcriptional regulator